MRFSAGCSIEAPICAARRAIAGPELASFVDTHNARTRTIADIPYLGGCEPTPCRLLPNGRGAVMLRLCFEPCQKRKEALLVLIERYDAR